MSKYHKNLANIIYYDLNKEVIYLFNILELKN